jgi:GNAT superfamily N-acetyltransferase
LVISVDGTVVGTVTLVPMDSPMRSVHDPSALEVRMLAVEPAMQRRGFATTLIAAARARATARGHRALVLQSDEDLTAAHALYEAMGFVRRPDLDVMADERYRALGYELALDE